MPLATRIATAPVATSWAGKFPPKGDHPRPRGDAACHMGADEWDTFGKSDRRAIRNELTQSQFDTLIDEIELYLSVMERDDKGHTYGLGWTQSGLWRRHAGARFSRPMYANDEPIKSYGAGSDGKTWNFAPLEDPDDDSKTDQDLDD
ncbi:hypothetical protein Scep_012471 [Stephania cephalantha]|uniref:Uncharacterized protein n=1 Tax=Stephania cephalantha TaxID=152367 RepID=A0AAP0JF76_9MAGN